MENTDLIILICYIAKRLNWPPEWVAQALENPVDYVEFWNKVVDTRKAIREKKNYN